MTKQPSWNHKCNQKKKIKKPSPYSILYVQNICIWGHDYIITSHDHLPQNTDMITTLILFSWYVTTEYFTHLTDKQVKKLLYSDQQKQIMDDILPAGFMPQDQNEVEETFVDDSGTRWFSINDH